MTQEGTLPRAHSGSPLASAATCEVGNDGNRLRNSWREEHRRDARGLRLRVATYNVHACVGTDGRHDPERIARVLDEIDADLVGLQELDSYEHDGAHIDQFSFLVERLGMRGAWGPTVPRRVGHFGNALLSRAPIGEIRKLDLSTPGHEARGALEVELALAGQPVRVVVTHLGLRASERRYQIERLCSELTDDATKPLIVLGDFNEWWPMSGILRRLNQRWGSVAYVRSFPSRMPLFALDRIWVSSTAGPFLAKPHVSAMSRVASDHLPVYADVVLPPA